MSANVATNYELKQQQIEFLEEMAKKHGLPDASKALRCLITYAMEQRDREPSIFQTVRCTDC